MHSLVKNGKSKFGAAKLKKVLSLSLLLVMTLPFAGLISATEVQAKAKKKEANTSAPPAQQSSDSMPPEAPPRNQAAPPPSPEPMEEMPPMAPPINQHTDSAASNHSSPIFTLQAKHYAIGEDTPPQQYPRIMRPTLDGRAFSTAPLDGRTDTNQLAGSAQVNQLNPSASAGGPGSPRSLTQVDIQRLANHEVVLLIDRSASMAAMDCPTSNLGHSIGMIPSILGIPLLSTSRWQWCLHQTSEMSKETQNIFNRGITVVLFSSGFITFPNVTMDQVQQIFQQNYPAGGTDLAPPLATQIGEYFKRREYARGNVKPLMIGIITDGCPSNKQAVRQAIVDATHLMKNPQEVTIIFFVIGGMDFQGEMFVRDLCTNLTNQGAAFPIVKEVSFSELQHIGLAKAIAQNLQ